MAEQRDPFRNYKFRVSIDGFVRAGFTKVSGLERETEIIEYREGGMNETMLKLPGQTKFTELAFERGMMADTDMIDWANQIFNPENKDGKQPTNEGFRKNVTIFLVGKDGKNVRRWIVYNAWPSKIKVADLQSDGNDVLVESMDLAHEGYVEAPLV